MYSEKKIIKEKSAFLNDYALLDNWVK